MAKKDWSRYDRERKKTGSVPPPHEPSAQSVRVREFIPRDFIVSPNPYDDDVDDNVDAFTDGNAVWQCIVEQFGVINYNVINKRFYVIDQSRTFFHSLRYFLNVGLTL